MIRVVVIGLLLVGLQAFGADYTGSFTTSYGQKLGPEESESSLSFEPLVQVPIDEKNGLEFGTVVNRPLDPHKNFQVPRTAILYGHDFGGIGAIGSLNALDIDRWSVDGMKLRMTASGEYKRELLPWLALTLRAGPFVQANRYAQDAAGRDHPRWGFTELVKFEGTAGNFEFDVRLVVSQLQAGGWRNDYATFERVAYRVVPGVSLGIAHELVSGAIDDTTGLGRPVRLFDSRDSRVSIQLELEI